MKRTFALIISLLLCLVCSFTVFGENIFIIEDGEDEFIAETPAVTTTQPVETTTASSELADLFDSDVISGYVDSVKDMFGEGIDSLLDGFDFAYQTENTTSVQSETTQLPSVDSGNYAPVTQASAMTTYPVSEKTTAASEQEQTTVASNASAQEELPSVLIVYDTGDDSWGISGSTLTLVVFIAAIIIFILVVIIALILMTRKTEFDSAIKTRSTLPMVEQPDSLAHFIEGDDESEDEEDYGNIAYWND